MFSKIAGCFMLALLAVSLLGGIVIASDWPLFHYDPSHAGYTPSAGPTTNNVLWSFTTGGTVESGIVISNGCVYAPSTDNSVYCINATTGAQIWKYTTGGYVWGPAVSNGFVYIASDDYNVYCLNAQNGTLVWSYTTAGKLVTPTVANSFVYVGSQDRHAYCLDAQTGAQVWNYTFPGYVYCPSISGGYVYIGCTDGNVYCLNSSTGAKIWNYATGGYVVSTPAISGGLVYVGSYDHSIYCLNSQTGSLAWSYSTGNIVFSSPAVANGYVYFGSEDNSVYCLNAQTGVLIWSRSTSSKVLCSPALSGNGYVYIGSEDHSVYCFNANTGIQVWKYATNGVVTSAPAIADDMLCIGSFDGKVYAFATTSPVTNSSTVGAWVPPPNNTAAAVVVSVALMGVVSFIFSVISSPLGGVAGGIGEKIKDILPDNIKSWLEDYVEARHEIHVTPKKGSTFLPTKPELWAYGIAIVTLTLAFSYAEINSLSQLIEVLPLILVTSVIVVLVKTFVSIVIMRRLGVWSEHQIWPLGLILFLISTLAFRVPFSSPTRYLEAEKEPSEHASSTSVAAEAHFQPKEARRIDAVVSACEILIGLAFAGVFFILLTRGYALIGSTGLAMCLISSFFESLPIKPLSGKDIYDHSKMLWAAIFLGTLLLFALWVLLL